MVRAVLTERDKWMAALMLDPETGLDPPGAKVRAAQGLDAGMSIFRTQLPVTDVTNPQLPPSFPDTGFGQRSLKTLRASITIQII